MTRAMGSFHSLGLWRIKPCTQGMSDGAVPGIIMSIKSAIMKLGHAHKLLNNYVTQGRSKRS
jgi:hypothetical protein